MAEGSRTGPHVWHEQYGLIVRTLVLVVAYVALRVPAERLFWVPLEAFERSMLLPQVLLQIPGRPVAALHLLACVGGVGVLWALSRRAGRTLWIRWSELEHGGALRALVVTAALLVAWYVVAMAPNRWSGQTYALDRLVVLLAAVVTVFRPIGSLGVGLACMPLIYQLFRPFGGYSAAEIDLPITFLLLAGVATMLQAATGRSFGQAFVVASLSALGAHYWIPGWGKLSWMWIADDQLRYLLPATYLNGWWGHLTPDALGRLTASLAPLNLPMKVGALALEVGMTALFVRRGMHRALLVTALVFHVGVFALAGICFWKWAVLEGVWLVVTLRTSVLSSDLFRPSVALTSFLLVLGSPWWCRPPHLAWHDSRISQTYRVDGIGASGERHALQPGFFEPYRYAFTMTPFRFLDPDPSLPVSWGATTAAFAPALNAATTAADVQDLYDRIGSVELKPRRAEQFDGFVRRYLQTAQHGDEWWRPLRAPPHLWTVPDPQAYDASEPLVAAEVIRETSLYVDGRFTIVDERVVRRIDAASP